MSHAELKQMVLIDTSVWIGFFSKTGYLPIKEQLNKLLDHHAVAIAGPIVLELLQGCRSAKERRTLRDHFEGLHWFVTEDKHWFQAGEMANDLRQRGITLSAMDALMATLAQSYSSQLMHLDQDYKHIAKHTDLSLFQIIQ